MKHISYTRTTTHTAGIRSTHALINERTYAQCHQYTLHDCSLLNQYTQRTSTTVTTPNQYTIATLTPVRRDRVNLPPSPPSPTCHVRQVLQNLLRLVSSILPILGAVLSLLVRRIPVTNTPPRTHIHVSDTRDRILYSKCHGENDDGFHFCQWCATPSTYGSRDNDIALLYIDKYVIEQLFAQFTKAVAEKPSTRRLDAASLLFKRFLQSRLVGGPANMVTDQPNDVVGFLCWLDSCSEKRRTAAHARDCEAVGISELSNCTTTE